MSRRGDVGVIGWVIILATLLVIAAYLFGPEGAFYRLFGIGVNQTEPPRIVKYNIAFGRNVPEAVQARFAHLVRALDGRGDKCYAVWTLPKERGLDGYGVRFSKLKDRMAVHLIDPKGREAGTHQYKGKKPCAIAFDGDKRGLFEDCVMEDPVRTDGKCRGLKMETVADYAEALLFMPQEDDPDDFKTRHQDNDYDWDGLESDTDLDLYFYQRDGQTCPVIDAGGGDLEDLKNANPFCGIACTDKSACGDFTPQGEATCKSRPCNLHCFWDDDHDRCKPIGVQFDERCADINLCEDYAALSDCQEDPCRFKDRAQEGLRPCFPLFTGPSNEPDALTFSSCRACHDDTECEYFRRAEDCGTAYCGLTCTWTAAGCVKVSNLP